MGGPIVRSGASQKYASNWDQVFGGDKQTKPPAKKKKAAPAAAKKATKAKKKKA